MKYSNVTNLKWADLESSVITCDVDFEGLGITPFSASLNDTYGYTIEIFNRALSGEFGSITPYATPVESPEKLLLEQQQEARKYLKNTDWYLIRQLDTGVPVPEDIAIKRAEARAIL